MTHPSVFAVGTGNSYPEERSVSRRSAKTFRPINGFMNPVLRCFYHKLYILCLATLTWKIKGVGGGTVCCLLRR
jgi:hypothetical protein